MRKNPPCQSGFFNPRILIALTLCSVGALLAMFSFAATPSSGTLTDTSGPQSYTAGPFFVANPTPILFVDQGPECFGSAQPCDDYVLTVTLPAGYAAAHPNAAVKVTMDWTDAGSGASDYDLYIYRGAVTNTDGSQSADYQSASSADPEIATISPVADGTSRFTVKVVPYTPTGGRGNGKIDRLSRPTSVSTRSCSRIRRPGAPSLRTQPPGPTRCTPTATTTATCGWRLARGRPTAGRITRRSAPDRSPRLCPS